VGPPPAVRRASRTAAEKVHEPLAAALEGMLKDNGIATDRSTAVGRKKGGALIGSIHSKVPVVLIEMVVLSSRRDAAFIKSESGQKAFAAALADGIRKAVPLADFRPVEETN
jgi:N-acetylmuramoyl-L-alanine amidase